MSRKDELSDYELLRMKNMDENKQKMMELGIYNGTKSPDFLDAQKPRKVKTPAMLKAYDNIGPIRSRRSSRLNKKKQAVVFSGDAVEAILGTESTCVVNKILDFDHSYQKECANFIIEYDEDNKVIQKKENPSKRYINKNQEMSADDVTDDHLMMIAKTSGSKVYSQDLGTTCHQCRQKTVDQKTICRSGNCFGVRGQFCGPCLLNRYGESAAEALKNPDWTCPVCRNMCNCSICRTHAGKIPTGQLFTFAQQKGFSSVKHFLEKEEK